MEDASFDVAILGAGISGLAFAHQAARAGLRCLVLEAAPAPGGCIHTVHGRDGFWFELGAHTLYNSYGGVLDLLTATGLDGSLQEREKAPFRLFVDGHVRSVGSQVGVAELLFSAWRVLTLHKEARSVADYYGRLVGPRNWQQVFSPLLSAVPSQVADDFPAEMLFKRRPRRKDVPRTFTLRDGLGTLVTRLAATPGITLRTNSAAVAVERGPTGYTVTCADGSRSVARSLTLALSPDRGARLLAPVLPAAAAALAGVRTTAVDSTGVILAKEDVPWPRLMGLAAKDDLFFSVVSRDVVPDPRYRGLAFHFRSGLPLDQRIGRMVEALGSDRQRLLEIVEHRSELPSPVLGHADIVRDLDQALAGQPVYVTGNYFGGLALEDCAQRSAAEVRRLLTQRE